MADKIIGEIKGKLNRNRNDLLTAKGARQNALSQIKAPNLSDAERAKFRKIYQKYDAEVKRLEAERKDFEKELTKARAEVPEYNKEKGTEEANRLKEQYNLLVSSYNSIADKNSADAVSTKQQIDDLVVKFQKAYSESIGTPVSLSVARANISGTEISSQQPTTLGAPGATTKPSAPSAQTQVTGQKPAVTTPPAKQKPVKVKPASKEEAAREAGKLQLPGQKPTPSKFEDLISRSEFWYNLPDYIFKVNPALQNILVKAVDEGWTEEKFLSAAQQTPWWQQNSSNIRTRIVNRAKYDELRSQGLDVSKTEYALDSASIRRRIQSIAQQKGANLSPEQLDQIVSQAYDGFLENDSLALTRLVAPYIGTIPAILGKGLPGAGGATSTYSGEALKNYQTLQDIARQNGFKLSDILPRISTATTNGNLEYAVLQKLSTGELDVNAIAQNARMLAAAGQPQYVRDLLNQGYNLSAVYAPYRTAMAGVLELNPDQIDLNDPTLRAGITDKGDMNLYDYRKLLKQDNRWQYTSNAAQEVSNAALGVLRDFGFMG